MSRRRDVTADELEVPLLDYEVAIARVVEAFPPLPAVRVLLLDAVGLVLAEDAVATDEIPAFDNSAMDGYAVRSADLVDGRATLAVGTAVAPGVAVKVMTGFPIPEGADAVVPWERASAVDGPEGSEGSEASEGSDRPIEVEGPVEAGTFVRPTGGDVHAGQTVLRSGTRLGPVEVGMLAAIGAAEVAVHPRPRVGVLSTGDELVGVDEPVGRGRVRDANAPMLAASCVTLGGVVSSIVRTPDDPDEIGAALEALAADSDLVVSSGGASVGERDWLRAVLERHGPLTFWKVNLRPGKPVALGRIGEVPIIVLPGNPGSVAACTHVFVARAIRSLAGRPAEPLGVPATLTDGVEGDTIRTVVHPVVLDGGRARPAAVRSSQVLSNAVGADGWLIVPPGGVRAGEAVTVELDA